MAELPDEVRALFEGPNYGHVATLLPDGSPHSVAVWVGLEGEEIVFFTQTTSQKSRNLERDPRVAISMVDHDDPYMTARIRGQVTRTTTGRRGLGGHRPARRPLHGRAVPVPPGHLDRLLRRAGQGGLDAAAVPASPGDGVTRPQGRAPRPHRGRGDPRARAADRGAQRPARPRRRDRRRRPLRAGATSSTSSTPTTAPPASSGPARTTATSSTSTS